jgi:hypothetical protein
MQGETGCRLPFSLLRLVGRFRLATIASLEPV